MCRNKTKKGSKRKIHFSRFSQPSREQLVKRLFRKAPNRLSEASFLMHSALIMKSSEDQPHKQQLMDLEVSLWPWIVLEIYRFLCRSLLVFILLSQVWKCEQNKKKKTLGWVNLESFAFLITTAGHPGLFGVCEKL